MNISLLDLKAQYSTIRGEIEAAVKDVFESGHFILGPNVAAFEEEVASYMGAKYAVGVASGTDALHLALLAADVGDGDEVITTPFSFIATAEAISYTGAIPVFADIDPLTFNLDVSRIEAKISPRTKAILPVHLYGQPAPIDDIVALAKEYNLRVIEDCAQAIGARYKDRPVGAIGDAGALSFFPSKNLGGCGDGGMVVTDNAAIAERIRLLRAHGSSRKYSHDVIGYNSRLDELQAAVLRVKLKYLDDWNGSRRRKAAIYDRLLSGVTAVAAPYVEADAYHVYHLYTLRVPGDRERLREILSENGIASAVHYPVPIHLQPAYARLGIGAGLLPESESASKEVLSLPLYPELEDDRIEAVAAVVGLL